MRARKKYSINSPAIANPRLIEELALSDLARDAW